MRSMNLALMMKLGWGTINQRDSLWARVLHSKYNCGNNFIPNIGFRKKKSSSTWEGSVKAWDNVNNKIAWNLGNCRNTNFWLDKLIPKEPPLVEKACMFPY